MAIAPQLTIVAPQSRQARAGSGIVLLVGPMIAAPRDSAQPGLLDRKTNGMSLGHSMQRHPRLRL
jgi:hypothetical protein